MSIILISPADMAEQIKNRFKNKRLEKNLSQRTLAERAGVSYGTLKRFEQTGLISLEALLKLAIPLDSHEGFNKLFRDDPNVLPNTLEELLLDKKRQRGRE